MPEYDNTNSGMLSKNDRKTQDSHAEYTGFLNVEGVEYWLDGRVREAGPNARNPGRKFFSLKLRRKVPVAETPDIQFGNDGTKPVQGAPAGTRDGSGQGGGAQGASRGSQGAPDPLDDLPF